MNEIETAIQWLKENSPPLEDYGEMIGAPPQYCGVKYVYNDPCGYVFETAIEALEEKLQRLENLPLTLEELKQMIEKPIWTVTNGVRCSGRWEIIESINNEFIKLCCLFDETYDIEMTTYGKTWFAYRYEKGETNG